jgi:hypothetical protein
MGLVHELIGWFKNENFKTRSSCMCERVYGHMMDGIPCHLEVLDQGLPDGPEYE